VLKQAEAGTPVPELLDDPVAKGLIEVDLSLPAARVSSNGAASHRCEIGPEHNSGMSSQDSRALCPGTRWGLMLAHVITLFNIIYIMRSNGRGPAWTAPRN
jgi:hypothetical protein